jgi:methylthioribose-1-phosphate isomerase
MTTAFAAAELRPIHVGDGTVTILDQAQLPYRVESRMLCKLEDAAHAIRAMQVRGAPLIGVTAACGIALALIHDASDSALAAAVDMLAATRPTAVNLRWALARMSARLQTLPPPARANAAWDEARAIAEEDAASNHAIGEHGRRIIESLAARRLPIAVMTHCNAGWLATAAYGTALAPVYAAHAHGIGVHVFVSETRPRNQGLLTTWELGKAGVAHTLIADNAAGHLMQRGAVDLVIVGADRIAANGDTANKIGTYLKALAAQANGVPFYVAAPGSTIDWQCSNGRDIPIEERDGEELRLVRGVPAAARIAAADMPVANPAFDVTPAALVTGIITERGVAAAQQLAQLFTNE